MTTSAPRETLHAAIDRWVQPDPEYAGGLSDHLPMALHALWELGASDQQLEGFAAAHPQARPRPLAAEHGTGSWGCIAAYPALRADMEARLARHGRQSVLQALLPRLLEGVAAAFHGAIRTAHALEAAHDGELAAGLAYWAARWQRLPAVPPRPAADSAAWLDAVWAARTLPPPPGRLITARIAAVVDGDAYRNLAGAPALELAALQRWAAARYAASGNFTVLHLVTASRALGVLLPGSATLPQPVVRAVAAAVQACGAPAKPEPAAPPPPDWPALRAAARAARDDHAIKLTHTAWRLARQHGDAQVFRQAAARAPLPRPNGAFACSPILNTPTPWSPTSTPPPASCSPPCPAGACAAAARWTGSARPRAGSTSATTGATSP